MSISMHQSISQNLNFSDCISDQSNLCDNPKEIDLHNNRSLVEGLHELNLIRYDNITMNDFKKFLKTYSFNNVIQLIDDNDHNHFASFMKERNNLNIRDIKTLERIDQNNTYLNEYVNQNVYNYMAAINYVLKKSYISKTFKVKYLEEFNYNLENILGILKIAQNCNIVDLKYNIKSNENNIKTIKEVQVKIKQALKYLDTNSLSYAFICE